MAEKPRFCDECGAKLGPNNGNHWRSCSAAEVDLHGSEQANDQGIYLTKLWFWISTQPTWRIILGVFALVVLCLILAQPFSSREEGNNAPPQRLPSIGKQVVTSQEYHRIQTGMSYREVVAIIGNHGEEMSQNRIEGVPGVMNTVVTILYSWTNNNGSNMNAIFQNDKLIQKAQFGLK